MEEATEVMGDFRDLLADLWLEPGPFFLMSSLIRGLWDSMGLSWSGSSVSFEMSVSLSMVTTGGARLFSDTLPLAFMGPDLTCLGLVPRDSYTMDTSDSGMALAVVMGSSKEPLRLGSCWSLTAWFSAGRLLDSEAVENESPLTLPGLLLEPLASEDPEVDGEGSPDGGT